MTAALGGSRPRDPQPLLAIRRRFSFAGRRAMKKRVIARKRGVIPGCIPAGQDSHMAVDSLGRPWPEVAKLPSTVERLGRRTREEIQQSRNGCGRGPQTALIAAPGLASAI